MNLDFLTVLEAVGSVVIFMLGLWAVTGIVRGIIQTIRGETGEKEEEQ